MRASETGSVKPPVWVPEKVLIHRDSIDTGFVREIKERLRNPPVEIIEHIPRFGMGEGSKDTLYIIPRHSQFLQKCPGTHGYYICCGYKIFDLVHNCVYGCEYCILRSYFQDRSIIAYSNVEDGLDELGRVISGQPEKVFRVGTGEFTDSLAMDHLFEHGRILVPFFARFENAIIELKTKSTAVGSLRNLEHNNRTIVSWSLNPRVILERLEQGTPGLEHRLAAAAQCVSWGYRVGFHFDPIIYFPGWEPAYESVIQMIFEQVTVKNIAWISMGLLRFPAAMKPYLAAIDNDSFLNQGETVRGVDGKIRYFKPLRISIFRKMEQWIRKYGGNTTTYLCMESPEIWKLVYPHNTQYYLQIRDVLDKQACPRAG